MRDVRELILLRLKAILTTLKTSGDVVSVWRDRKDLPEADLPALVLLDGKSRRITRMPAGAQRSPPGVFALEPQVWIQLREDPDVKQEDVGEELSALRVKVLAAIMSDDGPGSLVELQGENGQIEYGGEETDMIIGSDITGNMVIDISLTFMFDPADMLT